MTSSDTTSKATQSSSHKGKSSKKVAETAPDNRSTKAKKATATLGQNVEKAYDSITESFGGVSTQSQAVPYGAMLTHQPRKDG